MKSSSLSGFCWPVVISRWLLCRAELSHGAKLTYALMEKAAGKRRAVTAHVPTLAQELGEDEAEVVRFLSELIGWGLVEAVPDPAGGDPSHCFMPIHPWMSSEPKVEKKPAVGTSEARSDAGQRPLSRFPLDQCLKYTARLKELGEPIKTVKGFAWYIYRYGTHDEEIAAWVTAKDSEGSGEEPPNVLAYKKRG